MKYVFLIACVGAQVAVHGAVGAAQPGDETKPASGDVAAPATPAPSTPAPGEAEEKQLRFNFNGAPFDMVLDFLARETGLPVVREAEVPGGTVSFISSDTYTLDEAIEIFNLNLRLHGLRLEREDRFLYLRSLADAARRPTPVTGPGGLRGLDAGEYVTLYVPLSNAVASSVAEQLAPLVKEPGLVRPIESQNILLIVETAGQASRLSELVSSIDAVRPSDVAFRVFPVRYASAGEVSQTLSRLIPEREQKIAFDKNGNPRVYDDVTKPPLKFTADERIGGVVAVGPTSRMGAVQELLAVLDSPDGGAGEDGRGARSIPVFTVSPGDASRQLDGLFRALPERARPVVRPIDASRRVLVVGTPSQIEQAEMLLRELDPGSEQDSGGESVAAIRPEHVPAGELDRRVRELLPARTASLVRSTEASGGERLVLAGPAIEIERYRELAQVLDEPRQNGTRVTLIDLGAVDAAPIVERATELDALAEASSRDPVRVVESGSRGKVVLVGSEAGLARYERLLRQVASNTEPELEQFVVAPERVTPSVLAERLQTAAAVLLSGAQSAGLPAPQVRVLGELGQVVVDAHPSQVEGLRVLAQQLDVQRPGDSSVRIFDAGETDANALLERARSMYETRGGGTLGELSAVVDETAGKVIVSGRADAVRLFTESVSAVEQLVPPARTMRVLDLEQVGASDLLGPLREMLEAADPIEASRAVPAPDIAVLERTNSLLVTAEPAQHELVAQFVRRLDRIDPGELPPLRLLQLRTADANAIAQMLSQQYARRTAADRQARPVDVRADGSTNTLIVSAHEELFDGIRSFVEELNAERTDEPDRVTVVYPLTLARADAVAAAMNRLYPEPPMPLDRRGNPMPWLRPAKEVTVTSEPGTNALIIDAPADRLSSLEELAAKLDRARMPATSELRTYPMGRADAGSVSTMLQGLARRGALAGDAGDGAPPAELVIEADGRTNTLIVAGDDESLEKVEQVLESLTATPAERELRVIQIMNTDAASVRARAIEIYEAQSEAMPNAGEVRVVTNEAENALEVVADAESMERFVAIVEGLQERSGQPRDLRLFELRRASAATVVEVLRELMASSETLRTVGGAAPTVEAVPGSEALLVAAQPAQMELVAGLIRELDEQDDGPRAPVRIFRVRTADAQGLATVLQRNYDRRPSSERAEAPVDIQADASTNTLVVSAHASVLPEIEAVVAQLNEQASLDEEGREIRVFPLRIARAEELARTIDQMYPEPPVPLDARGRPRPDLKRSREVVVRADRATNALIVDAPARRMQGFERLVESLDTNSAGGDVVVRTFTLDRASPDEVAKALREFAAAGALGGSAQSLVSVHASPAMNAVVVGASGEVMDRVAQLVDELEGTEPVAAGMQLFPLEHARADRLAEVVRPLIMARAQALAGAARGTGDRVEVTTDAASNTIIVTGPQEVLEVAGELVASLDTERSATGRAQVRIVPLEFADANDVSEALRAVLGTLDVVGAEETTVRAAASANAVVLSGSAEAIKRLAELADELDISPSDPERAELRAFTLEHARATSIAPRVQSILEASRQDPLEGIPWWARANEVQNRARRGLPTSMPPVSVEADERTNTLLVSATPALLETAAGIVEQLDAPGENAQRVRVRYEAERADPTRLVQIVTRVIEQQAAGDEPLVELFADPAGGGVVAVGEPMAVADALSDLAMFDQATIEGPPVGVESVELMHADARAVAATVEGVLRDRAGWPEAMRRAARGGIEISTPSVTADQSRNTLVVRAPEPLIERARTLVETLDRPASRESVETRVFSLSSGDAESIARAIELQLTRDVRPSESRPVVSAEPVSNAILVSASADRLEQASEMIAAMDQVAVEPDGIGVRTIFLEHARADALAEIVERALGREDLLDMVPEWQRLQVVRDRARAGGERTPEVRVEAEPRLNALIVSAPRPVLDLGEEIIRQLDVERGAEGLTRELRVITLANAEAATVGESVSAVFDDEESTEKPPTVRVDQSSNSLIVRGTPVQVAAIETLARRLDAATLQTSRGVRTIPLDRSKTSAEEMARTIRRLLEQNGTVKVEVIGADELLSKPGSQDDQPDSGTESGASSADWRVWGGPGYAASIELWRVEPEGDADESGAATGEPTVRIVVDPETNSLVVEGSERLTERVEALARALQDEMPTEPVGVRLIELPAGIDPRAVSQLITQTVRQVGRSTVENPGGFTGRVAVAADDQGGALVVWANDTDFATVRDLIAGVSRLGGTGQLSIKVYPLVNVTGDRASRTLRDMLSPGQTRGSVELEVELPDGTRVTRTIDPARVGVTTDPSRSAIVVTAPRDAMPLVDKFVEMIDRNPVGDRLEIRRYTLSHAQAQELSSTMQRLFDAQRQGPGSGDVPRARFVADERTNAILATATEEQHAMAETLIASADEQLDDESLELSVLSLQVASPREVAGVVEQLVIGRDPAKRAQIRVSAIERSSVLVVRAPAEETAQIREIVGQVDTAEAAAYPVRAIRLERADAQEVASALQRFFRDRASVQGNRGQGGGAAIVGDRRSGTIVIAASDEDYAQIESLVAQFDAPAEARELRFRIIPLEHVRVTDVQQTLQNISYELMADRNGWWGSGQRDEGADKLVIETNERTNAVVLFGQGDTFDTIEQIIAELDQPGSELGDTVLRAMPAPGVDLNATAQVLTELTATPGWRSWWGRDTEAVTVRVDRQRGLLLLVGKRPRVEEAVGYLEQIIEGGSARDVVETVQLKVAQASEMARTLGSALPDHIRVRVTPVTRTNTLLLTGQPEDIAAAKARIDTLDVEPERSSLEFQRFVLEHADAADVAISLRALVRNRPRESGAPAPSIDYLPGESTVAVTASTDEMGFIASMIEEFDQPTQARRKTEFVRLEFAAAESTATALKSFYGPLAREARSNAERNVSIVPDPASNSLVISADEEVWPDIRALLSTLDTEEYDTSQQLVVIPLQHASAQNLARALNEGFRAPLNDQLQRERVRLEAEQRQRNNRDFGFFEPTVLVESEGVPVVSAEPQTNSLVVFAGRRDLERIRALVRQLDVPEFLKLPPARVVPLSKGIAADIAGTVARVVMEDAQRRGGPARTLVFADEASNSIIVRAEDEEFDRIAELISSLEERSSASTPTARVVRLTSLRANRARDTILGTFRPIAQRRGETLAVEIDRAENALLITASDAVFDEIDRVLTELERDEAVGEAEAQSSSASASGTTSDRSRAGTPDPAQTERALRRDTGPGGAATLIVDVSNNDPREIANVLQQMGVTRAAGGDGVGIVLDAVGVVPLTGSRRAISLTGSPADVARVRELITRLDTAPITSSQHVRLVPVREAQASRVANVVRGLLDPASQDANTGLARALAEQVRRLEMMGDGGPMRLDLSVPVRILADDASNTVIVMSTESNAAAVAALVETLDTLPVGEAVTVRIFPLMNASAERLRGVVTDLFNRGEALRRVPGTNRQARPESAVGEALAGEIAVSVDARTNSLIVAGREQAVALVEVLVRDLDADGADRGWVETAVLPLEYADATRLAQTLDSVLVDGLSDSQEARALRQQVGRLRVVRSGGEVRPGTGSMVDSDLFVPLTGLVIRAEAQLNALLVVGSPANIAVVRELAAMLDVSQVDPSGEVRVLPLQHADATRVAGVVEDVFSERARRGNLRDEDAVAVSVDARTNALVVSTSRRSFEVLESLLETLDREEARFAVGLHVLSVPSGDVERLAPKVERLMRERLSAQGGGRGADTIFRVEADPATSSLIVAASDENVEIVRELVTTLATGGDESFAGDAQLIQLESVGRADEIAEAIRRLYVEREQRQRGEDAVRVVASDTLNAIVVNGTPADVAAVRELVAQLDAPDAGVFEEVRRIPLESASARDVVDLLEDVLAGRSIGGGQLGGRATRIRVWVDDLAAAEATIDGAVRDHVTLTPDPRTNSVLIKAPPSIMELIEAIVRDLDSEKRGDRVIERFRLENADAVQMQSLLVDLFSLTRRGSSYVLMPVGAAPVEGSGAEGAVLDENGLPRSFTAVPDEQRELSVTVDRRTNTLLVSGTEELLEEVREIVNELDAIEATNRERVVYHLRNADASEVQETLEAFFRGESDLRSATLGPQIAGSALRQLDEEVTIVGDPASNKLVISASPRYIEAVTKIVEELDEPPPQVMIQVLLAEVTLDASTEFGIDIALGGTIAVTDSQGLPNQASNSPFGGDGYVFDTLAAGAGVATALGVPNLAIASGDFGLLIRALQAQGKLEVLSRPQVQVANNQEAEINVGENIAITDGVERRDNTTTAIVRREDVGILLNVTPNISPDGFVRLDITPEISQLSPRTTQIDEGFEAPIISQRRVDTTVTVRDGQSVVIGGLIQTSNTVRKTKVPGLGDLPLIGGLFRTNEESSIKTELLVILTPFVIPGDVTGAVGTMDELTRRSLEEMTDPSGVRRLLEGTTIDGEEPFYDPDWDE